MADDAAAVADELAVLAAVYGDAALSWRSPVLRVSLPGLPSGALRFRLPPAYPSTEPPELDGCGDAGLRGRLHACWRPGQVALFDFLSGEEAAPAAQPPEPSPAACAAAEARSRDEARLAPLLVHGDPVVERRSSFTAHACPVACAADVALFRELLMRDRRTAAATHNILAYRFAQPGTGLLVADCDDDGEDAAGGRLLHLLTVTGACGVAVVVSRVFGGILLGPERFKARAARVWPARSAVAHARRSQLINNAARDLLAAHGWVAAPAAAAARGAAAARRGGDEGG